MLTAMTVTEHATDSRPHHPTPAFAQPKLILFVFLGGMVGVAARLGLTVAIPEQRGDEWAVLTANLLGPFLLGFLLTALASRTPETPGRRDFRLFAGTGIMGGFTTYSSLATNSALLVETDGFIGVAYALGTLIGGILTAFIGVWLAGVLFPTRPAPAKKGGAS